MKTLEEIEKEYETYPIKTDVVTNLDEFLSFMEVGIDDKKEYQKDDRKELRAIKRTKTLEKIHDFIFFMLKMKKFYQCVLNYHVLILSLTFFYLLLFNKCLCQYAHY